MFNFYNFYFNLLVTKDGLAAENITTIKTFLRGIGTSFILHLIKSQSMRIIQNTGPFRIVL